ncbi:hypothetical protein B0T13DRAFT_474298 [Neurospora crassa]|nr:hypothetical protein B0T13DRAFT_474298 [Neurospora crassa]
MPLSSFFSFLFFSRRLPSLPLSLWCLTGADLIFRISTARSDTHFHLKGTFQSWQTYYLLPTVPGVRFPCDRPPSQKSEISHRLLPL